MKISHTALSNTLSREEVIDSILEQCDDTPSLVSGAHQMLLSDGQIETFGAFAEVTSGLALDLQKRIAQSRLFLQLNDQLDFRGLSDGKPSTTAQRFWREAWTELAEEGHVPQWPIEALLARGIDVHGEDTAGLVSEWALQRWHITSGLNNSDRFNKKPVKRRILEAIQAAIPDQETYGGARCRANGCANEIMMQAPFAQERGYNQIINLFPAACRGPVNYGSTLACYASENELFSPIAKGANVQFRGPFRFVNVFASTQGPKNLSEVLDGAMIVTVETDH